MSKMDDYLRTPASHPYYIDNPCPWCVELGRVRAPFPHFYINYCQACAGCGRTEHNIEHRGHHPDCPYYTQNHS